MAPFGGWDMPIQYPTGILREVAAVRTGVGMFDVSHMGRIEFSGPGAAGFLDCLLSANVAKLRQGRSRYHVICNEAGGIIDDALVYRPGESLYLLVVNAGNFDAVSPWIAAHLEGVADLESRVTTDVVAMIAVQGPDAVGLTDKLSDSPASSLRPFAIGEAEIAGVPCRVARTGYTGEDGFEIMPRRTVPAGSRGVRRTGSRPSRRSFRNGSTVWQGTSLRAGPKPARPSAPRLATRSAGPSLPKWKAPWCALSVPGWSTR